MPVVTVNVSRCFRDGSGSNRFLTAVLKDATRLDGSAGISLRSFWISLRRSLKKQRLPSRSSNGTFGSSIRFFDRLLDRVKI